MSTNQYPESWKFDQHGEKVVGIVTDIRDVTTQYGPATVMEVRSEDHDMTAFSVWMTPKALQGFIADMNPQPGDRVSIHRVGSESWTDKKSGEERMMWVFDAVVLARADDQQASKPADDDSDDLPF